MSAGVVKFHHVNITVARRFEEAAKDFYASILGLQEVPKPEASRARGGAWYQLGDVQLHLSIEDAQPELVSSRHICLVVKDLARAEKHLEAAGLEIISDPPPVPGTNRFYVRDPGHNLIEIVERN